MKKQRKSLFHNASAVVASAGSVELAPKRSENNYKVFAQANEALTFVVAASQSVIVWRRGSSAATLRERLFIQG